jgi:GT2 family glycosyltransferase
MDAHFDRLRLDKNLLLIIESIASDSKFLLTIVLKAKNETTRLRRWLDHYQRYFGFARIIIFDNNSSAHETHNIYNATGSNVSVFSFSGVPDNLHIPSLNTELYRALRQSSEYYIFVDTDELLLFFDENGHIVDAEPRLTHLSHKRVPVIATHWCLASNHKRGKFLLCDSELLRGGKPILHCDFDISGLGIINHNIQLFQQKVPISFEGSALLLHTPFHEPEERLRINTEKLIAYGAFADKPSVLAYAMANTSYSFDAESWNVYLQEIREILTSSGDSSQEISESKNDHDLMINLEASPSIIPADSTSQGRLYCICNNISSLFEKENTGLAWNAYPLLEKHHPHAFNDSSAVSSLSSSKGDALNKRKVLIILGNLQYNFRPQRPQHIASALSRHMHVIYVDSESSRFSSNTFNSYYPDPNNKNLEVWNIDIPESITPLGGSNWYISPGEEASTKMVALLYSHLLNQGISPYAYVVMTPFWWGISKFSTVPVVYDCMDYLQGFDEIGPDAPCDELCGKHFSEHVVYTSHSLCTEDKAINNSTSIIRNGFKLQENLSFPPSAQNTFSSTELSHWKTSDRLRVLYVGAISHWFDHHLLIGLIEQLVDVEVIIAGRDDINLKEMCSSIGNDAILLSFLGEVSHPLACELMNTADIGLIPLNDQVNLIKCTNPVKLYEYLYYGCHVFSTNIPEVLLINSKHVTTSSDNSRWIQEINDIARSFDEKTRWKTKQAVHNESNHLLKDADWDFRGMSYMKILEKAQESQILQNHYRIKPKLIHSRRFSIIMPSMGNHSLIVKSIESLFLHYSQAIDEVIVVINGSFKVEKELRRFISLHGIDNVTIICNDKPVGFARAINVGASVAQTKYIMISNDDIIFSPWSLHPYLWADEELLENNCLNAVATNIDGDAYRQHEYITLSDFYRVGLSRYIKYSCLSASAERLGLNFACLSLAHFKNVGGIPTSYGLGYYEDDEFYANLRAHKVGIRYFPGAYVHHVGSFTFQQLGFGTRARLLKENKLISSGKTQSKVDPR